MGGVDPRFEVGVHSVHEASDCEEKFSSSDGPLGGCFRCALEGKKPGMLLPAMSLSLTKHAAFLLEARVLKPQTVEDVLSQLRSMDFMTYIGISQNIQKVR